MVVPPPAGPDVRPAPADWSRRSPLPPLLGVARPVALFALWRSLAGDGGLAAGLAAAVLVVAALLAAGAVLWAARRGPVAATKGWRAVGIALLGLGLARAAPLLADAPGSRWVGLAAVLAASAALLLAAATLVLAWSAAGGTADTPPLLLDVTLALAAPLAVGWGFAAPVGGGAGRAAAFGVGAAAAVLLAGALAALLTLSDARARVRPAALLAVGFGAAGVAPVLALWAHRWGSGRPDPGHPLADTLLLACVLGIAAACRAERRATLTVRAAPRPPARADDAEIGPVDGPHWSGPRLAALALAVLFPLAALAWPGVAPAFGRSAALDPVASAVGLAVAGAAVLRLAQEAHGATRRIQALRRLAERDPLTGLPNARALRGRLERELARGRATGAPVSVVLLDVDGFKAVNDTYGHPAGNGVLRALAWLLEGACRRGTDTVARYGGDEFVLVLPGLDAEGAHRVCGRLVAEVRAADAAPGVRLRIGLSVGVAVSRAHGHAPDALLAIADAAMYEAKRAGKGRVRVVDAEALLPAFDLPGAPARPASAPPALGADPLAADGRARDVVLGFAHALHAPDNAVVG